LARRRIFARGRSVAFAFIVLEAAVALLTPALPALPARFAAAALAAFGVGAIVRSLAVTVTVTVAIAVTVAVGLAVGALGLAARLVFYTALLGLLSGDDRGGLSARFVLEIDVEALARQFALGDLADRALRLKRA